MKINRKFKKVVKIFALVVVLITVTITSMHYIPTGSYSTSEECEFYLVDNGMHVDIVLREDSVYSAYGWGSKVFFTEVDQFENLTASTLYRAVISEPKSLMRIQSYFSKQSGWMKVKCSKEQYEQVSNYVHSSFYSNLRYGRNFYHAKGNYRLYYTCNSWVSGALKEAGLKAPLYTLTSSSISKYYK